MSPRTGRPKVDDPRTVNRAVRLTETEDAAIRAAAERDRVSMADYIRDAALVAAKFKPRRRR